MTAYTLDLFNRRCYCFGKAVIASNVGCQQRKSGIGGLRYPSGTEAARPWTAEQFAVLVHSTDTDRGGKLHFNRLEHACQFTKWRSLMHL